MKALILAGLLVAASASAETITLESETCTQTNICFQVPNDAGVSIDYLSNALQYHRLIVSIDGELFDSGIYTVFGPIVNVPLYAADGSLILATLNFTITHYPCYRSGKVTVCAKKVVLTDGTLVR